MDSLDEMVDTLREFIRKRDWEQFHSPKNLSMSIAIEAAELMEHFQWITISESRQKVLDLKFKEEVQDEMADILIYLVAMSIRCDINLKEAFFKKLNKNERRFPPVYE